MTANCEITCSLRSLLGYQVRVISSSFVGNFSPKKTSFLLFDSTYDLEIEFFDNIMRKNQIVTIAQFSENYRRLRSLLRGPNTSYLVLIRGQFLLFDHTYDLQIEFFGNIRWKKSKSKLPQFAFSFKGANYEISRTHS